MGTRGKANSRVSGSLNVWERLSGGIRGPRLFPFSSPGLFVSFVSRFAGLFRVPRGFSFLVVYLIPLLGVIVPRPEAGRRPTATCYSRFSLRFSFLFSRGCRVRAASSRDGIDEEDGSRLGASRRRARARIMRSRWVTPRKGDHSRVPSRSGR